LARIFSPMITLRSAKLHRTHLRLRMPFRYGIATLTELPHVILAFTFEIEGRVATGVAADHLGKTLGAHARRLQAQLAQLGCGFCAGQHLARGLVKGGHHILGSGRGREDAVPALHARAREQAVHGGNLRQGGQGFGAAGHQGAQPAALHLRQHAQGGVEHHVHLTGQQGLHRRRIALVGDVLDLYASGAARQLHVHVLARTGAGAGVVELARLLARLLHQLLHGGDARLGVDRQHIVKGGDLHHWRQVLDHVIRRGLQAHHRDHGRGRIEHKGVTIGRALGHMVHAHRAAGARTVVDHHRLLEHILQLARDQTGHHIERAAGHEGHDQADRSIRVGAALGQSR
jgi:hypothetical protein